LIEAGQNGVLYDLANSSVAVYDLASAPEGDTISQKSQHQYESITSTDRTTSDCASSLQPIDRHQAVLDQSKITFLVDVEDLSRSEAEQRVLKGRIGCFLVRASTSDPGKVIITINTARMIDF
jgi:hypothetical protein